MSLKLLQYSEKLCTFILHYICMTPPRLSLTFMSLMLFVYIYLCHEWLNYFAGIHIFWSCSSSASVDVDINMHNVYKYPLINAIGNVMECYAKYYCIRIIGTSAKYHNFLGSVCSLRLVLGIVSHQRSLEARPSAMSPGVDGDVTDEWQFRKAYVTYKRNSTKCNRIKSISLNFD